MKDDQMQHVAEGSEIIYRMHPGTEPLGGIYLGISPDGKFVAIGKLTDHDDYQWLRRETVVVMETVPDGPLTDQLAQEEADKTAATMAANQTAADVEANRAAVAGEPNRTTAGVQASRTAAEVEANRAAQVEANRAAVVEANRAAGGDGHGLARRTETHRERKG